MAKVAKALSLGLEFHNWRSGLAFEIRKSIWISPSASSYSTDINATGNYNQVGFSEYLKINSKKSLGINLSHIWIAEYDVYYLYRFNQSPYFYASDYWTSKAISFGFYLNLSKNLFVEIRGNYYYYTSSYYPHVKKVSIPKGINENRIQMSLSYKFSRSV